MGRAQHLKPDAGTLSISDLASDRHFVVLRKSMQLYRGNPWETKPPEGSPEWQEWQEARERKAAQDEVMQRYDGYDELSPEQDYESEDEDSEDDLAEPGNGPAISQSLDSFS